MTRKFNTIRILINILLFHTLYLSLSSNIILSTKLCLILFPLNIALHIHDDLNFYQNINIDQ